jgi:hypothetical protein
VLNPEEMRQMEVEPVSSRSSRWANTGFVLGLLSLVSCAITAIPAVLASAVALSKGASGRLKQRAVIGLVLGLFSILVVVVIFTSMLYTVGKGASREAARIEPTAKRSIAAEDKTTAPDSSEPHEGSVRERAANATKLVSLPFDARAVLATYSQGFAKLDSSEPIEAVYDLTEGASKHLTRRTYMTKYHALMLDEALSDGKLYRLHVLWSIDRVKKDPVAGLDIGLRTWALFSALLGVDLRQDTWVTEGLGLNDAYNPVPSSVTVKGVRVWRHFVPTEQGDGLIITFAKDKATNSGEANNL